MHTNNYCRSRKIDVVSVNIEHWTVRPYLSTEERKHNVQNIVETAVQCLFTMLCLYNMRRATMIKSHQDVSFALLQKSVVRDY